MALPRHGSGDVTSNQAGILGAGFLVGDIELVESLVVIPVAVRLSVRDEFRVPTSQAHATSDSAIPKNSMISGLNEQKTRGEKVSV